jgi:hypothetical protein
MHSRALEVLGQARAKLDPADADLAWLAACLDTVLSGAATFEQAAGLRRRDIAVHRCHSLIGSHAQQHHGDEPLGAQARSIATEFRLFEARHWPSDRLRGGVPASKIAAPRASLFLIFEASNGKPPRSAKQIARILKSGHLHPFECPATQFTTSPKRGKSRP